MEGTTLATMITNLGTVFTGVMGWAATIGSTVVDTPILFVGVSIPIVGAGIGFFRRLLRMR